MSWILLLHLQSRIVLVQCECNGNSQIDWENCELTERCIQVSSKSFTIRWLHAAPLRRGSHVYSVRPCAVSFLSKLLSRILIQVTGISCCALLSWTLKYKKESCCLKTQLAQNRKTLLSISICRSCAVWTDSRTVAKKTCSWCLK